VPLQVELVSPERILYSGEAEMVIARTVGGGDIAFLPGHAPFVGALEVATVTIRSNGPTGTTDELIAVHGGFVEVSVSASGEAPASDGDGGPVTTVTILSDAAERAGDIDAEAARRAKEAAEEKLRHGHDAEAEAEARRAHVRLTVAGAA
jgi:F-type H+-transporting ATPase subunit epsilon